MAYLERDLNTPSPNTSPSLAMSEFRGQRYPNQFFDLSQQYMPPTLKELFKWCTFYFYNSPLIGATMKKTSRYPITDLIFEDDQESVRSVWRRILIKELKIKSKLLNVNLNRHVYGNSFTSLHFPFVRMLKCKSCGNTQPIKNWDWEFSSGHYEFRGSCKKCDYSGSLEVRDTPYKNLRGIRIIQWNAQNIDIKYNEYTGNTTYLYSIPKNVRNAINRGDKDILIDMPMIVIKAVKEQRKIRFNSDSIYHMKAPTLAEQDQGWGKPAIIHVLKDMYYFYTLRRAQEAIALEHILPCDIIFPMPNAQQDPYVHTDLGSWRSEVQNILYKHKRDPNFKGVIPVPVGTARIGGDGKMLLLTPELNYLNQTIVGGLGMSSEMLFGNGLNYTGSSITLRMLENDFIQNRSELIDLVIWIKDKIRLWANIPDIDNIKFSDFRMADDVQRNQQIIGLNAQGKISDQTLLEELGFVWEQEKGKIVTEIEFNNYISDLQTKGTTKSQGEASILQYNYQKKLQEMMASDANNQGGMVPNNAPDANNQGGMMPDNAPDAGFGQAPPLPNADSEAQMKVDTWAQRISQLAPEMRTQALMELKSRMPQIASAIEQKIGLIQSQQGASGQGQNSMNIEPNMNPMPTQKPPRRAGAM